MSSKGNTVVGGDGLGNENEKGKKAATIIHFPYEKMEPEKDKPAYSGSRT